MVKKVASFLNQKNTVSGASIILMVTLALSNLLGVVRDHYLTQKIPTELLSVYYSAFRIPDFIFNILILGAITSAFIPVFTSLLTQKKEKEAWIVASSLINLAIIILVIISILLATFIPYLVKFVVPGFNAENQALTANLARIMLLSPIFFGLSYIFSGILNSYKRFAVYSLAPLVYNLTIILGTVFFADKYGIQGVAFSVVVGALLHFLVQVPVAIKLGFKWQPIINWKNAEVKRVGLLMIPRSLALGTNQIMLWIFTAMASYLGGYSIAVYNLADNIQTMPMIVFGTSFATAIFPSLSEHASTGNMEDFKGQILKTMRVVLFFMIPATILLFLLKVEAVRLILGSGHFGWGQTRETASTLGWFAFSLIFAGLIPLFYRAFYAFHNTRIPMIGTLINVVVGIVLAKLLIGTLGVESLAIAYTVGCVCNLIYLYFALSKKIDFKLSKSFFEFLFKVLLSSVFMGLVAYEAKIIFGSFVDTQTFMGIVYQSLAAIVLGLVVYLGLSWLMRLEEICAIKVIFNKFSPKRGDDEQQAKAEDLD